MCSEDNRTLFKLAKLLCGEKEAKGILAEKLITWTEQQPEFYDLTLSELKVKYPNTSAWRVMIGQSARQELKRRNRIFACAECGYDKHVDVCHIQAVKSFGDDDKIGLINAVDNLLILCKNHHWEFDHPDETDDESEDDAISCPFWSDN